MYKKRCKEKECKFCGAAFTPTNGNQRLCQECRDLTLHARGRVSPNLREDPRDRDAYEEDLKARTTRRVEANDSIVAEGYAERQKAQTLKMAGKVRL